MKGKFGRFLRVLKVLHNIGIMCSWDLPDMSAPALRCCAPWSSCVHIKQIPPVHVTYITYETQLLFVQIFWGYT